MRPDAPEEIDGRSFAGQRSVSLPSAVPGRFSLAGRRPWTFSSLD
jgi:hypothetical protein